MNEKDIKTIVDEEIQKLEKQLGKKLTQELIEKFRTEAEEGINRIHAERDRKIAELKREHEDYFKKANEEIEKLRNQPLLNNNEVNKVAEDIKQKNTEIVNSVEKKQREGYLRQIDERLRNFNREISRTVIDEEIKSRIEGEFNKIRKLIEYYKTEIQIQINKQEIETMLKNAYELIKDAKNTVSTQSSMKLNSNSKPANSMTFAQAKAFEELTKQGWSGISGGDFKMYTAPIKNNAGQSIGFEVRNNEITVSKATKYDEKVREMFAKLAKAQFAGMSGEILVYHPDVAEAKKLAEKVTLEVSNPKLNFKPISDYNEYLVLTGRKKPEEKVEQKEEIKRDELKISEDENRSLKP